GPWRLHGCNCRCGTGGNAGLQTDPAPPSSRARESYRTWLPRILQDDDSSFRVAGNGVERMGDSERIDAVPVPELHFIHRMLLSVFVGGHRYSPAIVGLLPFPCPLFPVHRIAIPDVARFTAVGPGNHARQLPYPCKVSFILDACRCLAGGVQGESCWFSADCERHQISPAVSAKLAPLDNSSSSIRASSRSIFMIPTSSRSCRCRSLSISLGLARSVRVCSRTVHVRIRADADGEPFPASLEASRRDCFLLADASALSRVALLMRLSDLRHPDLPAGASPPARCRRAR